MAFYNELQKWDKDEVLNSIKNMTEFDVQNALSKERLDLYDFMALLSEPATKYLEQMAQRAHESSLRHFGHAVQLFTPLYLANYCTNHCLYCGFNAKNHLHRTKLTMEQIESEGKEIASTGLRHILLLTGDAPKISPPQYIADAAKVLNKYFAGIAIEVYSLTEDEYRLLVENGVDSMTLFQETYNEELYLSLHPKGPKRDFKFRIESYERAAKAGMQSVNIGALLGLDEWQKDAFFTGLHASWLQNEFPDTDIAISVPRMRPHVGSPIYVHDTSEKDLVQYVLALRLFLPMAGITLSTRERAFIRDKLLPLGVTRVSAGVSTKVGGHAIHDEESTGQFEIADERSVDEMVEAIRNAGYQAVFKNWEPLSGAYACGKI